MRPPLCGSQRQFKLRWNFYQRWSLVGVFGPGWPDGTKTDLDDPGAIPAGGGGFSYLIARRLGFQMGVDVAASEEDQGQPRPDGTTLSLAALSVP